MKDLIEFQRFRIEAMQNEIAKLKRSETSLKSYVLELADKDCPSQYKRVVTTLILQDD